MTSPINRVLEKLPDAKRSGKGWSARCPAHDDRRASLSIDVGDDGRALVHCHAGCAAESVMAALRLTMADLMPTADKLPTRSQPHSNRHILATYNYRDEIGDVQFQVVRYWQKVFRQRRPDGKGDWLWNVNGVRVVPYRLPELLAERTRPVVVVEGEKDADNLAKIGVLATCNAGGAGKWATEHAEFLRGRVVWVVPDNDEPGRRHAQQVAASLHGIAASVRIVYLPGLPDKGDVSDWLAAGGTNDELLRLAEATPEWTPTATGSLDKVDAVEAAPELNFVPFPVDVLPEPVKGFVAAGAAALGCDPAYIALPLMSALAAAVGNSRRVKLKSSWSEPGVLWTVIIGESGTMKSPALDLALAPTRKRQAEVFRDFTDKLRQHEQQQQMHDADMQAWKRTGRTKGDAAPTAPEPPVLQQLIVEDTTVEAVAVLSSDQPRGLLMARDELSGWLNSFDAYKSARGADVAHWLSMHRAGNLLVNRKTGRRFIRVPRAAISVCGGVQPRTLAAALAGRYESDGPEANNKPNGEHFANGLAARLLLAMPPRLPKRWTDNDLSDADREPMQRLFDDLFALEANRDANDEWEPIDLPLSRDAKARFIQFYNDNSTEQVILGSDLAAAWSKIEGYAARFALLFQLIDHPASTEIDDPNMERAIELARWFADEAARVYDTLGANGDAPESRQQRDDDRLAAWIRDRGGAVTIRDVTRGPRQYRGDAEAAETALSRLVDAKMGVWENIPAGDKGGRSTRVFRLATSGDGDETPANPENSEVVSPSPVSPRIESHTAGAAERVQVTI